MKERTLAEQEVVRILALPPIEGRYVLRACPVCEGSGKHVSNVGACGGCGGSRYFRISVANATDAELIASRDEARAQMEACTRQIMHRRRIANPPKRRSRTAHTITVERKD